MKQIYLLIITILLGAVVMAQRNGSIKGTLTDTLAKQPVSAATITVLNKKDSSLVTFTMTDNKGYFEVTGMANGDYRMMISHINYHNVNKFVTIDDAGKIRDLGNIVMNDLSKVLDEVVVTAEAPPVTLIGDTVQYNAGSFKVQPNADVESLLKKLPGIKVEKDGTIKAQGQEVKRVLVDGKEFFGTDPKIATKNLPADALDKVQVYDRMSDAAQLTGFDDGNSEKTINLKLKKDKKKGLFGKAMAGGGTKDRFEGRFNVNSFKGARQMSVIGMANNTNAEGFSFMDMLNFTGELNRMRQGGNGSLNINLSDNSSMQGVGSNNTGLRTIWGTGINYNNIIGSKTDFTSNFFYNHYNPKNESHIQRQYLLPDSSYFYNQNSYSNNINNSQRLNLSADIKLDSFHSLKISPSFGYQQTRNSTNSDYETLTQELGLANRGRSNNYSTSEGFNFRNDLLFRKKFRTKGRTLSLSLQTSINNSEGEGNLVSVNEFFKSSSAAIRTDSINQTNTTKGDLRSYSARAVYTEPLFKRSLLEFSVGKSNSSSTSDKITYDYNKQSGKFDRLNAMFSNNFENTYGYTSAGLRLRTQQKKFSLAAGLNWQQAELEGKIISGTKDSLISKTFYNLLPNARFQYNFNRYKNLSINYSAITSQPTVSQLQPVPDNSNPLNIRIGNPDLKQEFTNAIQLNFTSVNPFKNKNLFAFFTLQQTQNKIVNYDIIDSLGRKTTKPVNVNGVLRVNGDISLGLPVRFLKGTINLGSNMGYNKGRQFINGADNNINSLNIGPELRLEVNPDPKFDFSVSAGLNYYNTKYSLRRELNTEYFSQQYGTDVNWQLPKSFYFNTGFTYTINSQRASGFNTNVPLWNASLSKQFLRFNRGELKLSAYDLLNQNIGINRTTNLNYIEDSRVVNLQRYFLLSFTYSLSKNGLGSANDGGGTFRVIR
jgi:hypothetical protein